MSLLHTVVAFIIALGLLIVVHEYGHYLVARLFNVKVLRFHRMQQQNAVPAA